MIPIRWLLLALLVVSGCRTPQGPALRRAPEESARIERWVEQVAQEAETRTALRAVGWLWVDGRGGSGRVRQVLIAERPDRLRFESLNWLGQTSALLVSDGDRFAFFDGSDVERGAVSADTLRVHLGLDLRPEQAVALLLAAPPLPSGPPRAVFVVGEDRIAEYEEWRLRFGPQGRLRGLELRDPLGPVLWRARYDAWRELDGTRYPFAMDFDFPSSELRARLELDSAELNPRLDVSLFALPADRSE